MEGSTSTTWPPKDWTSLDRIIVNGPGVLGRIHAGGAVWPVTLEAEDPVAAPSWLTSMTSALIATPRDEVAQAPIRTGRVRFALGLLDAAIPVARWMGLQHAVIVNNTLFSVSMVGSGSVIGLMAATAEAARRWPHRTIFARGIVSHTAEAGVAARALGGVVLPNRISYTFDLRDGLLPDKINVERDIAHLKRQSPRLLQHDDFDSHHLDDVHRQYRALYVERHGSGNPDFEPMFFHRAHGAGAVEFLGLADGDKLLAFAALRDHGEFVSVPLFGYKPDAPPRAGLYRMMFARVLALAAERRRMINFGAGAGHFKRLRGGQATVEHMILIPPRQTVIGLGLKILLSACEKRLNQWIPQTIVAHGG